MRMYLTREDHAFFHVARNMSLVALSLICLPGSLALVLIAKILASVSFIKVPKPSPALHKGHQIRVLVTGVSMTKGLFLARALYQGGCIVVSADFETNFIPACGRFSQATARFYALKAPRNDNEVLDYIEQMLTIVRTERIDVWVSCSGVATAIEDARLMEIVQKKTDCKAFQFNEDSTFVLDNKFKFMKATSDLGFTVPRWFSLNTPTDINRTVEEATDHNEKDSDDIQYILKNVAMDDRTRGSLPLLSSKEPKRMREVLESLDYDGAEWILQQFIPGLEEYCTHSVVVDGRVAAFLACPSTSVLMHYSLIDSSSPLYQAMLMFTQKYASAMHQKYGQFSGHFSFDFLALNSHIDQGMKKTLMPIECNPRCHTAVVHLRGYERELTSTYMSVLSDRTDSDLLVPCSAKAPQVYYWLAHDLVTLYVLPIAQYLASRVTIGEAISQHLEFWHHVTLGRDATFEWWDPFPFFVLNHIYWPSRLVTATWHGIRWSQLNVSTGKMFEI